ncbi:MAG: L-serine ammonia-lyase [Proteobacteria bacterium]|uniref:L-serine ammonia-lyase n=1 Tax=Aquabacterium sp. TaxID=1872578 RepID=UPI0035C6A8DD|nr:L-serine ammonia-lyase [Pseudomonadota bacterium]
MAISVFDLFKVGIGPSSSHTVGPMRAARQFALKLDAAGLLPATTRITATLMGSLGATGRGHASDRAIVLGLMGQEPDTVPMALVFGCMDALQAQPTLAVLGRHPIAFDPAHDLVWEPQQRLPFHPNALRLSAWDAAGLRLLEDTFYSVGGGFIVPQALADHPERHGDVAPGAATLPLPFQHASELLQRCAEHGIGIAEVMRRNEARWHAPADIDPGLDRIWQAMQDCVIRGCHQDGELPGGFHVHRRAPALLRKLLAAGDAHNAPTPLLTHSLTEMDWVTLWALAVNEENAAGGRVVTAPTNGAAGIVPAVLHHAMRHLPGADDQRARDFLLTAAAIGLLFKENASISGAEVGCQGEVGVACAMAAAGLCAVMGGTPEQVENAAEIGMEHHLGLTCDPVGGLVQIPCIERNAVGAVQAIHAARLALLGDGRHRVSLDDVIRTMKQTGADMQTRYKETALGGLAVHIVAC